jgi:SAM-dependent methyltransferase
MLEAAAQAAAEAGVKIKFIETAVEYLHAEENSFDVLTIGRVLHWLERDESLAVFGRILAPGGRIVICGSTATDAPVNSWVAAYKTLRKAWSSEAEESRHNIDPEKWFDGSSFQKVDEISIGHKQTLTVDDLVHRALSFSLTSPALLGDRRPQFETDARAAVEPFARDGLIDEELIVKATVFG